MEFAVGLKLPRDGNLQTGGVAGSVHQARDPLPRNNCGATADGMPIVPNMTSLVGPDRGIAVRAIRRTKIKEHFLRRAGNRSRCGGGPIRQYTGSDQGGPDLSAPNGIAAVIEMKRVDIVIPELTLRGIVRGAEREALERGRKVDIAQPGVAIGCGKSGDEGVRIGSRKIDRSVTFESRVPCHADIKDRRVGMGIGHGGDEIGVVAEHMVARLPIVDVVGAGPNDHGPGSARDDEVRRELVDVGKPSAAHAALEDMVIGEVPRERFPTPDARAADEDHGIGGRAAEGILINPAIGQVNVGSSGLGEVRGTHTHGIEVAECSLGLGEGDGDLAVAIRDHIGKRENVCVVVHPSASDIRAGSGQ